LLRALILVALVLGISNELVTLLTLVEQLPTLAMKSFVLLFELISLL
jgi:hypothetical protein